MAEPTVARPRRRTLAMKVETTYGTDVFGGTVAASDILPAFNIRPLPRIASHRNLATSGLRGRLPSVKGAEFGEVSFALWARGKGAAYSASVKPEVGLPLRGCGVLETGSFGVGTEKYEYTPRASGDESMTIYVLQENGPTFKIAGAYGNAIITFVAGSPVLFEFAYQGILVTPTDLTLVTNVPSATPQHPIVKSAQFQLSTENYAARVNRIMVNLGNVLDPIEAINAAGALAGVHIADRDPRGDFDPELTTLAAFGWFAKWQNGTEMDMSWQAGSTQYNQVKCSLPKIQFDEQRWGERGQKATLDIPFLVNMDAGSDELKITFD